MIVSIEVAAIGACISAVISLLAVLSFVPIAVGQSRRRRGK